MDKTNQPRIALVANMAWNLWNYRRPVIEALQQSGYEVMVIAPVDDSLPRLLRDTGVQFIPLEHFRRNSTSVWNTIRMMVELVSLYKRHRPSLILHYGVQAYILGALAAYVNKIPSVSVVTGLGYTYLHRNIVHALVHWLNRLVFRLSVKVVFENAQDRELMVTSQAVSFEKTVVVSGCGIKAEEFFPRRCGRSGRRIVFAYFGRLLYDKGLREFYEAALHVRKHFPNSEFRLFGTLDKSNPAHIRPFELLHWIKSGVIRYMGVVDDVRPYMAETDVVVLPSYREGLSRTLLEAMAMACPIVVSDVPGCRETVEHGVNGLLVPPRNAAALAEALLYMGSLSSAERFQMGKAGHRKVLREFSAALVGHQYCQLVHDVLPLPHEEKSIDHRHHRAGRRLPRRVVAEERV